jgi:mono/diheme cytochrome c family protein
MNDKVVRLLGGLVAVGAVGLLFLNWLVGHAGRAALHRYVRLQVVESHFDRGRTVFVRLGCTDCHAVRGLALDKGSLGPGLDGVGLRAARRRPGLDAQSYLFESIESPGAYVVDGYLNLMPALRDRMTDQECADLVAFLLSLTTERAASGRHRHAP